jgi:hypothetical protein
MKTLITEYRGWEIYFDTEKDEFYTISNEYDKDNTKKSFASTKKFIDDYIKDNNDFKPILVQNEPTMFYNAEIIRLIGIRKDGDFMYEDKNGKRKRLSSYNEKDYFLINHDNDSVFSKIKELEENRDLLHSEIKELRKSIIKVDVREIKKRILGTDAEQ